MRQSFLQTKGLSLWNKIKYSNLNIFRTRFCKPLIFQTQIIWSNRIHSLKYLRSATFGSKDIVIRKSEFVAKTQFLSFLWKKMIIQPVYKMIFICCEFYYEHLTVKHHVACKARNLIHGIVVKYFAKTNTHFIWLLLFFI